MWGLEGGEGERERGREGGEGEAGEKKNNLRERQSCLMCDVWQRERGREREGGRVGRGRERERERGREIERGKERERGREREGVSMTFLTEEEPTWCGPVGTGVDRCQFSCRCSCDREAWRGSFSSAGRAT